MALQHALASLVSSSALARRFASARLPLTIESQPLDSGRRAGSAEIVQLDIGRTTRDARSHARERERYRIFLGNTSTNHLEVTSVDRAERQLVLVVDEPARRFTAMVPRWRRLPANVRVLAETPTSRTIELNTPGQVRHLLCGEDDGHLFIAQLPRVVASVADAHAALAPEIPSEYRRGIVRRQGEWFFAPATVDERAALNVVEPWAIRRGGLAEIAQVRRRGRQHLATELCVLTPARRTQPRATARLYARGQIWHPDHTPLALRGWHRVFLNNEPLDPVPGLRWVD